MGKEPIAELKNLVSRVEAYLKQTGARYDLDHLAGPQGFTTMHLYKNQDKEVFIKDIERELKISKSVASNLIQRMEKNGFVSVVQSQEDKRYKKLVLTDLGMEKASNLEAFFQEVREHLLEGVTEEDLLASKRVFDQVRKNLDKKESL